MNLVALLAGPENCANNQPCKFGFLVEGHAVYCHNKEWKGAPRKCRRSWYSNGKVKDEDCEGFKPNPDFMTHTKEEKDGN